MIRKILILFCGVWLLGSCAKELVEPGTEIVSDGQQAVPVEVGISIPDGQLYLGGEYIPMSRAEGDMRTRINNQYRVLIMKNIDGSWVVERNNLEGFTGNTINGFYIPVSGGFDYKYKCKLTPGKYRILIILNPAAGAVPANAPQVGEIISETNTQPVLTYMINTGPGFENTGKYYVPYEIFAGTEDFEVFKSTNVHDGAIQPTEVDVEVSRRVSKMRIVLQHQDDADEYFPDFHSTLLVCYFLATPLGGEVFCSGINAFGRAYYDATAPLEYIEFCTDVPTTVFNIGGHKYRIGVSESNRVYAPYFITDPDKEIDYEIYDFSITGQQSGVRWAYREDNEEPIVITRRLINNSVDGLAFIVSSGQEEVGEVYGGVGIKLNRIEDDSILSLYDPYFEYNAVNNP